MFLKVIKPDILLMNLDPENRSVSVDFMILLSSLEKETG